MLSLEEIKLNRNFFYDLIDIELDDLCLVGYVDFSDDALVFEKTSNRIYLKFKNKILLLQQVDLEEGVFVKICESEKVSLGCELDDSERECEVSILEVMKPSEFISLHVQSMHFFGVFLESKDECVVEGLEMKFVSDDEKKISFVVDPYNLSGLFFKFIYGDYEWKKEFLTESLLISN